MAYGTATLTGTYKTLDGQPASGVVEIIPNSRQLVDPEGDVILSGRVKVPLDETGAFSVTLPATDDATVEPATGRQYTVVAKLRHTHLAAVTGVELATGATVDVADLASAPVVDPLVSTAATTAQLDALEASLSPVATSGAYSDLTGAPTIPATAADVGAEPAGTTAALDASLAPVAKSGAYSDLTAKPTIPTTAADVNALPDTTTAADIGAQDAATLDADTAALVGDTGTSTGAALSASFVGQAMDKGNPLGPVVSSWRLARTDALAPTPGGWDSNHVAIGHDVAFDPDTGKYAMLYSGWDGSGASPTRVGLAYSDDLLTWTKHGTAPVFDANPIPGQRDSGGVTFPQFFHHDGQWHMFYVGFPNPGFEQGKPGICYATADTLTGSWTRHGVMLMPEDANPAYQVIYRPNVVRVGATWYMFFNAGGAVGWEEIFCATADDLAGPWTPTTTSPILPHAGLEEAGTNTLVSDPEVIRVGDHFVMYFWAGSGTYGKIYYATTTAANFPHGWQANPTPIISPGYSVLRPVLAVGPQGPVLYVTNNPGGAIDAYRLPDPSRGIPSAWSKRTSGDLTVNSSAYINLDTGLDLTLPAAAGDVLDARLALAFNTLNTTWVVFDVVTIVSGSPVNSFSSSSAPSTGTSHPSWAIGATSSAARERIDGGRKYTVQAADVVDGTVTLRVRVRCGNSVVIRSNGDPYIYLEATNLGSR